MSEDPCMDGTGEDNREGSTGAMTVATSEAPMEGGSPSGTAKEDGLLRAAEKLLTAAARRGGIDVQNDKDVVVK